MGRNVFTLALLFLFLARVAVAQDGGDMRYITPEKLTNSEIGKWVHLDFGRRSFSLRTDNRPLDSVTIDVDGKPTVFVEHRIDDGFNNWFDDQYLESRESLNGRKLRWVKNKLLSLETESIKVEAYFEYFTPTGNPYPVSSFKKELSFGKSTISEVLVFTGTEPRDLNLAPDSEPTVGSMKIGIGDDKIIYRLRRFFI